MLTTWLRRAWRAGRELPVLSYLVRLGDRAWWWRAIAASGLVDTEYYAAQRGWSRVGVRRAALDYVLRGHRRGLSLNPLVDELVMGDGLPEAGRVPALYAYLVSDRTTVAVHPWWDAGAYGSTLPSGQAALEHAWRTRADGELTLSIGSRTRTVPTATVRQWALEAAERWAAGAQAPSQTSEAGAAVSLSVVRLVQRGDRRYHHKLGVLEELASHAEPLVIAVDIDASQWVSIELLSRVMPAVVPIAIPGVSTFASAVTTAVSVSRGRVILIADPRSDLPAGDMLALAAEAGPGRAAIPAQLAADGTVETIGSAPVGMNRPYALLHGLPVEDLARLGTATREVPLLSGRTVAIRAEDLAFVGGLDSALVNEWELEEFSARWRLKDPAATFVLVAAIRSGNFAPDRAFARKSRRPTTRRFEGDESVAVQELLGTVGFDLDGWEVDAGAPPVPRLRRRATAPGSLRWAIKICSPAGPAGDVWGDTHFAHGLARALRRSGHDVVVDAFEARARPTSYLDDVTVVVRGPHRIDPPASGISLQWIISHPDEITRDELIQFDAVFAASDRWSRKASREFGIPITPLLECTDVDQFYPRGLDRGTDIVFVGTSRGIARPSVVGPLSAGIPVRVYGPDWRGFIPSAAIAASSIPNSELSLRYETAAVVLNDHWPAMRREGFMAMRPFDVVAAGGRVISEDVDGLAEVFGGAVIPYSSADDLIALLRGDLNALFPDDQELAAIAERVRLQHSFDARAAQLEQTALRMGSSAPSPNAK